MNRSLENYLRHLVAPNQVDWDECLVHAEFAMLLIRSLCRPVHSTSTMVNTHGPP